MLWLPSHVGESSISNWNINNVNHGRRMHRDERLTADKWLARHYWNDVASIMPDTCEVRLSVMRERLRSCVGRCTDLH